MRRLPNLTTSLPLPIATHRPATDSNTTMPAVSYPSERPSMPWVWTEHSNPIAPTPWATRSHAWWTEMSPSYIVPSRLSMSNQFSQQSRPSASSEQSQMSWPSSHTWHPTTSPHDTWPEQSSASCPISQPSWPSDPNEQSQTGSPHP